MVTDKSLDVIKNIIAALLHDASMTVVDAFSIRSLKLTLNKVNKRLDQEGIGFLTKTLPRLGKALDKALSGQEPLDSAKLGFKTLPNSKLPKLFGELFVKVLDHNGVTLNDPCVTSVRVLRQLTLLFYKYELPYTEEQEQQVISRFKNTEGDLIDLKPFLNFVDRGLRDSNQNWSEFPEKGNQAVVIARKARDLLSRLFLHFDPLDILPRHGPGAVATRQQPWSKYVWNNVSSRITEVYPFDEYFCSSLGHICDTYDSFNAIGEADLPARVVLVPKDSRGPRLISCEPVDFQWVQQGLMRAIIELVESHYLTKNNVHFTDQEPNRRAALAGSIRVWHYPDGSLRDPLVSGKYATLDLNEASDRVSLDLVRLLFPPHVFTYLEACRSSSTELPGGEIFPLNKFAPMGSALCFPVLALTVWAILTAGAPNADTRERILVYGDDVIVPAAQAASAIEQLELFGLKVNRDKSCISGFFRESCGMDAFSGQDVTPVRFRTVWSSSRSPDVYTSWIAYANSCYDRRYYHTYNYIVSELQAIYGFIPDESMHLACPSLRLVTDPVRSPRQRVNKDLQKVQFHVWDVRSPKVIRVLDGWAMLLRYFTEGTSSPLKYPFEPQVQAFDHIYDRPAFSVSSYTQRRASILARCWR